MIRTNVDIVAIAVLLAVLGIYSQLCDQVLVQVVAQQRVALARNVARRIASFSREPALPSLCPLTYLR